MYLDVKGLRNTLDKTLTVFTNRHTQQKNYITAGGGEGGGAREPQSAQSVP